MKQDRNGVRTPQDLERKYDFSSIKKAVEQSETGLTKINQELDKFVNKTTSNIKELQKQLDGKVTTYYYSGEPSFSNLPTSEWEESEYSQHLGDLYYDKDTGYVYMFQQNNGLYSWKHMIDKDLTDALALANAAKDTADNKRRVFVIRPIPPYDNGDLWLNDKELYVCQISKTKDETYEEDDFIIATKYTDDTVANKVNEELTVVKGQVTIIKEKQDEFDVTVTEHTSMINSLNEETAELGSDVSELKITSQSITESVNSIKNLTDYIKTKQETTSIELLKTPDSTGAINKLSIKNFNLQTLYPDMAYPSNYTYPGVLNFYTLIISNEKVVYSPSLPTANNQTELYNVGGISGKFYRCVDNVWTEETKLDNIKFIYINSPFPLQTLTTTMGDPVYDELIFEDNQVSIIQRLGYDKENNLEVLEKPVTYNLGEMLVPTFETNTYITMKYWTNLNYECTYIEKNEFTSSFTTKNETNALMSITNEINLKVENKCGKDDVVNQLNISKDLIEIKGNRFVLDADNVKIDKFGNIILSNGAKVLGEYGLLSSIIVESNIMSRSFIGGNMILPMGYSQYEETSSGSITTIKDSLQLQFTIPKGFKIMSAFILLEHMPTKYKDGTTLKYTGTSKNLKLYRATNYSAGTFVMDITRYVTNNSEINYSEVPNAFGVSGFSGSSSGYTSKQSINIKDFITTSDTEDSFNMFKIETSNSLVTSLAAMYQNTGACKATLMIMGYSSFE